MTTHAIPTSQTTAPRTAAPRVVAPVRTRPTTAAATENAPVDADAAMGRAVKLGTLAGIPLMLAFGLTIGLLAGTGIGTALAIALWAIINGAWFYGGIAFIPRNTEPWIHYAGDDTWTHDD